MRTLSQLRRLVIATFAFLGVGLIAPVADAMWPSAWTTVIGGAVIVISVVVVVATLHVWTQAGDTGETRPDHPDDEGGGGPRRDWPASPHPGGSGGGSDPSWWPEFEHRLALYVAEREMESRQPAAERN